MATNQMRRDAAKRKLAGQQARRGLSRRARRLPDRRDQLGGGSVVVILVAVVALSTIGRGR